MVSLLMLAGNCWKKVNGRILRNVHIVGLMMMASNVDDQEQIRREMTIAADLFDELKAKYFANDADFKERSWGMSHDYKIAVECRSTMVRVGTTILVHVFISNNFVI